MRSTHPRHYENFPVGSVLIPKSVRPHVYSIYAFARTADDFADEPGLNVRERLAHLADWEARLDACLSRPDGPIFTALAETIRAHDLPVQWLKDLLAAFRMDVTTHRHQTHEDLLAYCAFSANPIGRLILHLFGYRGEHYARYSDALCSALQLANFWQDIAIDLSRDRIYIPKTTSNDLASASQTCAISASPRNFATSWTRSSTAHTPSFKRGIPC